MCDVAVGAAVVTTAAPCPGFGPYSRTGDVPAQLPGSHREISTMSADICKVHAMCGQLGECV
jgi:hypothetical protein